MDIVHGHCSQEVYKFGFQNNGTRKKKKKKKTPRNLGCRCMYLMLTNSGSVG